MVAVDSSPSTRLRVALLSDFPAGDGILKGGIQSAAHALAHSLADRDDIECHVVSSTSEPCDSFEKQGAVHVHYVSRPVSPPRLGLGRGFNFQQTLGKVRRRLLTDLTYNVPRLTKKLRSIGPDVVHGQGQNRHSVAAVRSGYPAVVTPHGVIFIETKLRQEKPFRRWLADRYEREVFRRSQDMIIISRYLPQVYGEMLTAAAHFIDNPIDPSYFEISREPVSGRLLFVGMVVERKRVHDLVAGVAALLESAERDANCSGNHPAWMKSLELRIVGPLPEKSYQQTIERAISEYGLGGRVRMVGPLPQDLLFDEFRHAELLLLASQEETAPQVIAQAMACGLPIVASNAGGIPYMVEDGKTALLFALGDVAECSLKIRTLLDNEDMRLAMTQGVREQARSRFHPTAVAEKTVDVYRGLIARR